MRVKLIQSRMLSGRSNKLCDTISCTANFLARHTSSQCYKGYVESLVRLAAESMIYWHLVDCLSTAQNTYISSQEIWENGLAAATEANQLQLVKELLAKNTSVASDTRYFGEIFATAASSGSLSMTSILLQNWMDHRDHLSSARYIHAVKAAAISGHKEIVLMLLDHGTPFTKSSYDDAIICTARTCEASMVESLLSRRQQQSDSDIERAFWATLLRSTIEWNNQELLLHIIPSLSKIAESSIGLAVEDGCRKGYYTIVQILLSALPSFRARETVLHTGGLFWVARSGNLESLGFMRPFLHEKRHITRALAGAISGKRPSTITYLLRAAGVDMENLDPPTRFTDAIRLILPEAFSSSPEYPSVTADVEELTENLRKATSSDDLVDVIKIVQTAKTQYPNCPLPSFGSACIVAAENNYSDILLYLCENHILHLITHCARSTAILQIFIDFGWDFNQGDPSSKYGRLG
jgi:hypothetical protein